MRTPYRNCWVSCTPNAVPETKRSSRKRLSSSANNWRSHRMELKDTVKAKYGEAARRVTSGASNSCCGAASALDGCCDPITSKLYGENQTGQIPEAALKASLGCGNPTALADLRPGETVLDLGSGGGIDVLLSARRLGP